MRDVEASQKTEEHVSRAAPAANLLIPPFFAPFLLLPSQAISARSNGPQCFRHSIWRAAEASRVSFSLVWLHLCAQRTRSNTSRAAPAAKLTFFLVF